MINPWLIYGRAWGIGKQIILLENQPRINISTVMCIGWLMLITNVKNNVLWNPLYYVIIPNRNPTLSNNQN